MPPAVGFHSPISPQRRAASPLAAYLLASLLLMSAGGCAATGSSRWVSLRSTPRNPLTEALDLVARQGPKPTERTLQLLRRYNLESKLNDKPAVLAELNAINRREPNREHLYALSELAYIGAKRADSANKSEEALELYGSSVLYAYEYLFEDSYPAPSNEFDPQFRRACDLYNAALEGTLRIVQAQGALRPGTSRVIKTANHDCQLEVQLRSKGWHQADFDRVEFVSDYEVHGLRNHYHNFGLGVPLIAIRKHHDDADVAEQFYPPDLSFAVTAFLRIDADSIRESDREVTPTSTAASPAGSSSRRMLHAVLELHDPLDNTHVEADGVQVPLETDLSTPLAHNLSQPALDEGTLSNAGLLTPEKVRQISGLYMLEPFRADKIPVVMVHGLWSSPVTWMEMFNDLRSDPSIRENYQFWFYLYPSGQPFWQSAADMREDLAQMRAALDPARRAPALDQTILVGHSMGGLVSRLQTVDSGNQFWQTLSDKPFTELEADPELRDDLAETFFFDPNPSIRRVITIGTPHRGSEFSNDFTKWLGRKLIHVPSKFIHGRHQLVSRNPDYFLPKAPLNITNSVDSLSPESPILPVLLEAPVGPWVRLHNIIGHAPDEGLKNKASMWLAGEGDGVVSLESARVDSAASQIVVPADHMSVHRHPQSILEVRRILKLHIAELRSFPYNGGVQYADSQNALSPAPLPPPVAALPALESTH
ncbi:MAG TPA: alpha/beta fold hydrolase [Lacipirellula sp.]